MSTLSRPGGRVQSPGRCIALFLRPFAVVREGGMRLDTNIEGKVNDFFSINFALMRYLTFFYVSGRGVVRIRGRKRG